MKIGVPPEAASHTKSALGGSTPAHSPRTHTLTRARTVQPDHPHVHDVSRHLLRGEDARSPARFRHHQRYTHLRRPEAEPKPELGVRDTTLEETTLVDRKKQTKDKKRKRRDVVENE